jgi:site-specific DNA-cytosine methylase
MADALKWDDDTAYERNQQVPDPRAHVSDPADVVWPYLRPAPTVVGSFRPEVAAAPGYRRAGDPPRQATPGSVVTTLEERLILQDFPTDWIVRGNEASRALQVGNSVPVGMMRRVIEANLREGGAS